MRARCEPHRLSAGHAPRALGATVRDWLVLLGYEVVASSTISTSGPWSRGLAPGEGTGRLLRRGPDLSACPPARIC